MRPRPCTTCGALIVFVETAEGRRMPVDAATVRPGQDRYDAGLGQVPHWATCNAPARHRRGKGRRSDGRGRRGMADQPTRVGVSPPLEGVELELALAMAQSLKDALQDAYWAWLGANLPNTHGPDELMAGLGVFIGNAVRQLIGGLALSPAAAAVYRERWLTQLRADLEEEG